MLIGTNIIINWLLLSLTSKITGGYGKQKRIVLGAILSGFFSLYILLPQSIFIVELVIKTAICLLTVFITFGFINIKDFILKSAVFFGVTLIFCGGVLLFFEIFKPRGIVINNGTVYFNISPTVLIISALISYLCIILYKKLIKRNYGESEKIKITLIYENTEKEVTALIDSGNSLSDPLSFRPVIIISSTACTDLLGYTVSAEIKENIKNVPKGFRLIPASTINGKGILPAFTGSAKIKGKMLNNVIFAVTGENIDDGLDAIINPETVT